MTYHQRKQERQQLNAYLLTQEWNVFGTLKFVNGRTIGRQSAHKLLRSYWNKVDRTFFGKAAERQNMRLPRWCLGMTQQQFSALKLTAMPSKQSASLGQ